VAGRVGSADDVAVDRGQPRARAEVLTDTARFSSAGYASTIRHVMGRTILQMDPPKHLQHRTLGAKGWGPDARSVPSSLSKDKLREKIAATRAERTQIQRSLKTTGHQLDTGRHVFYQSLDLLDQQATIYRHGGEAVRAVLNRDLLHPALRRHPEGHRSAAARTVRRPQRGLPALQDTQPPPITGQRPREPRTAWGARRSDRWRSS
jgi:hypothetical protein